MSKKYDAGMKVLVETHLPDWLALVPRKPHGRVRVIDSDLATVTAENLVHKNPKTILLSALAVDALALMRTNNISQLIVINNENEYAGMIHLHDLVREGLL